MKLKNEAVPPDGLAADSENVPFPHSNPTIRDLQILIANCVHARANQIYKLNLFRLL